MANKYSYFFYKNETETFKFYLFIVINKLSFGILLP